MTNIEGTEGNDPSAKPNPQEGFALFAKPFAGEEPQVTHTPDGGFTIFLRGEIHIAYQPPAKEALESPVRDEEIPTNDLLPETTSPPVTEQHNVQDKATKTPYKPQPSESQEDENNKY